MPKRTQPKRTQFWSKRTHFFGQNVPSPPKRTQPFGQNVPNIFFPDIQYIFLLFGKKKLICTLVKTYPAHYFITLNYNILSKLDKKYIVCSFNHIAYPNWFNIKSLIIQKALSFNISPVMLCVFIAIFGIDF